MDHKELLINIYKAADYLGARAQYDANDLLAPDWARQKSQGNADAYAAIKQMVIHYDTMGSVDYFKVHGINKDLPNILK